MCMVVPILGEEVRPGYFKVIGYAWQCRCRTEDEIMMGLADREYDDYAADLIAERAMQHDADVDAYIEGEIDELPDGKEIPYELEYETEDGDDESEMPEDERLLQRYCSDRIISEMEERGLDPNNFSIIESGSEGVLS